MQELRFEGRVAVVTGAGRGLGRAYALMLGSRGAKVVVNDLGTSLSGEGTDAEPAHEVVAAIEAAGGTAVASTHTVATAAGAESIVDCAIERFGRVDIIVNSAGVVVYRGFPEVDLDDYQRHLDIHLLGSFNVARAAWPWMVTQGYGRVVMTVSSAVLGVPDLVSYASAKAGVIGLGRSLAAAGADRGIKVNIVSPLALTRMWTEGIPRPAAGEDAAADAGAGAGPGTPEQAAPLVAFLCHESCPVTGEIYRAAAGRVSRLFIAETPGVFAASPEEIMGSFAEINDEGGYFVPADSAALNRRAIEIARAAVGER